MSVDSPLSHIKWKDMRRQMKFKPRRFSKHFIASQLKERNEYRSKVRLLQNNPHMMIDFPYYVCMPNRIGSTVVAYCKKYNILQSGVVLAFFPDKAMYLIEFENVHFGCEFCPDSDVAACDLPTQVFRNKSFTAHRSRTDPFLGKLLLLSR
jgi:hypothetical protein